MDKVLDHVDGLTDDERAVYAQGRDGRWHLHPELAALVDEHEAKLAERQRREDFLAAKLDDLRSRDAYRRELTAAGIDRRLLGAAEALLRERGTVDEDGYARTEHGPLPVGHVVSQFLASPEGEAFQPKPATVGPFSAELRRLRAIH